MEVNEDATATSNRTSKQERKDGTSKDKKDKENGEVKAKL